MLVINFDVPILLLFLRFLFVQLVLGVATQDGFLFHGFALARNVSRLQLDAFLQALHTQGLGGNSFEFVAAEANLVEQLVRSLVLALSTNNTTPRCRVIPRTIFNQETISLFAQLPALGHLGFAQAWLFWLTEAATGAWNSKSVRHILEVVARVGSALLAQRMVELSEFPASD